MSNLEYYMILNEDECNYCGECEDRCVNNAITINDTVEHNPSECIYCESCVYACPVDAIEIKFRTIQ